jgi:hypothetical protein
MKFLLIILLIATFDVFAKKPPAKSKKTVVKKCREFFAERFDVNQADNFDLDIKDQDQVGEKRRLNNLKVYIFLEKKQNNFRYSSDFLVNRRVKNHIKKKIEQKSLDYYKLKDLENQTRQAVLIKDDLDSNNYISFLLYTNLECNLDEKN